MTDTDLRAQVMGILKTIAPELEDSELQPSVPLRDQVDLDSMDWLNFLVAVHERTGIDIPETDYARLVTMDDVVTYLSGKRGSR